MTGQRPARVLAVHRYYWPDTPPYASLLREIVRRWSDAGHDVDVLSTQPSYKPELAIPHRPKVENADGVTVRRLDLPPDRSGIVARLLNMVRFPLAVMLRVLVGRGYDVVMCSTAPPVVLAYATSLAARLRRASFVYHCMDIHPEIGALSGEFRAKPVFALLRALDRATCRRAAAIVVLSTDMRDALLARDPGLHDRIVVLNNFDLPTYADGAEVASPLPRTDRTRLVFTGNLGRFQGLEALAGAVLAERPGLERLELVLMGEGAAKAAVEQLVAAAPEATRDRVQLLPHGSAASARALVAEADFGVVSLTPEIIRYAYPSKTATYLAESTPIVALVETDSELATAAVAGGYGFAVAPDDEAGLATVLDRVASLDGAARDALAASAREAWQAGFSADTQLDRWEDLLRRLLNDREDS
ncbi:glycosyltransferase family 4 protein [Nocardioides jejuensis]|uniref:Glycosyltransferase WbuB n=1 Tax=Nocardioides jejuensis TaxID=2502782 RepID=A0A4R1CGW8_9ACTN|nr:glycosyltransferase family 4 protein [Nocardioides jejuensis]TCJ30201.1 glycosyltransferase WbuB [Nocardioides jejuensis]